MWGVGVCVWWVCVWVCVCVCVWLWRECECVFLAGDRSTGRLMHGHKAALIETFVNIISHTPNSVYHTD